MSDAPIGVFDSGVGGLTVLRALLERLPREHTIYLGDTARVPYGTRSAEVVTRYALLSGRFLAAQRIKLLVVACNTVSAHSLPALLQALPIPVVGVIEPGAQAASRSPRAGGRTIAVLGTPATVASGAYQRALARLDPLARVVARACPLFVPLAEEGLTDGEIPRLVAQRYLGDLRADTVLLGCTHYPLLSRSIRAAMGPATELVDSAEATAVAVEELLRGRGLLRAGDGPARHRTLCTDVPERFQQVAERFLGRPTGAVELVDLV